MSLLTYRCDPHVPALHPDEVERLLTEVQGWDIQNQCLCRTFRFADYHHTLAFVNAVAWIAHREDHHPEMVVTYNRVEIRWETHSVKGLSLNDFVCAAKVGVLTEG